MSNKSMSNNILVRVPAALIEKLRELHPELSEESDSTVVRIALNKYLREVQK